MQNTPLSPENNSSLTRFLMRRPQWKMALSCAGPLLFGGLFVGLAVSLQPSPAPVATNSTTNAVRVSSQTLQAATVLALEETLVTSLKPAGGYATLSGQLEAAIQVRGQAPVGGRVTEVLVRRGQQVNVGDPVMRVESRVKAPGSQAALRKQSAAEAAQVAAAKQEDALQARIAARQQKLLDAQQRVARAQQRVALAKAIVGRLSRGEAVSRADVAALATPELSVRLAARGTSRSRREEAREAARRDTQKEAWAATRKAAENARRDADKAIVAAAEAKREAQSATKAIPAKKQALKDAQTQLAKLEEQGTKGAELEAARSLLNLTQSAAQSAEDKAATLQKEAAKQEAAAEKLRLAAVEADQKLAKQPAPSVEEKPTPQPSATPTEALSASDAAQLASSALDESAAAIAQAEQLKREIDSYARQVKALHEKLTTTSENLESAQMQVVESKIAEKLEDVRAPASGVVLDVSAPARDVSQGETIIAIGRPDRLEVSLSDSTDAWKTLKTGTQLPAMVQQDDEKISVLAEVQEVEAPADGDSAQITLLINNPRRDDGTGRRFRPGLKVFCSIPRPGARAALSIPSAAVWRDESGQNLVAVLMPLAPQGNEFRVEWRAVTTAEATADGLLQEIAGGLQAGERIALRPAPLRELTLTQGDHAIVRLSA